MSSMQPEMIRLTIDDQEVTVPKGTTVFTAAKQLGIEIPIFCYQDRMPPFGACRVCLVEVEKMNKLQTACTLEATQGMVVKTKSTKAVEGRKGILEFLLINHPLDCPICDRGGECPLQENALEHGPGESRFYEEKRRFKKPLPLGPVLMLDRERCIVCARCTRFGEIVSGDHALEFIERGYKTEVGTPNSAPAESKFIGNTIMICPVGALTSQVYRFRARPWDNASTTSSCTLCPVGCSLILDTRDGEIMRTRSQENREVNDIWLCDKGWFGYEFSSHPERLKTPLIKQSNTFKEATWEQAFSVIADHFKKAKISGKLAGLGGNSLTVEENYLFQKLIREVGGTNHIDHRIGMPIFSLDEETVPPGMRMSIGECEELSWAVFFGVDLTEEFPVIWLRIKQAINSGAKVLFFGHFAPEIASYLSKTVVHAPGEELAILKEHSSEIAKLGSQGKGAFFVGSQYLASQDRQHILSHILQWQKTIPNLSLNLLEGRGNSMGARMAGVRPDLYPLGEKSSDKGFTAEQILKQAANNGWDFVYVAGADPASKCPSDLWKKVRAGLEFLVVQDLFLTRTAKDADVVLPVTSFVEKGGCFINIEGRRQTLLPGKEVPEGIHNDGEIFTLLAKNLNCTLAIDTRFMDMLKSKEMLLPQQEQKMDIASEKKMENVQQETLKATFAHLLFDHGVRMQHNSHLVKLAKEPYARMHPLEGSKRKIEEGEIVRFLANGGSFAAKIKFDRMVALQTVVLPLGFEKVGVYEFGMNLMNGIAVKVERC